MHINYDLCSLLQENKTIDINVVRKSCEVRAATMISKAKVWNPFTKGKHGRDLSTELLIPKHITEKWKCEGELRALTLQAQERPTDHELLVWS